MTVSPLPRSVRLCAILALVLGTCSGMNATSTALSLMQSAHVSTPRANGTPEELHLDEAVQALQTAQQRALRPVRGARVAVALLLSVATMFTLVIALRLLIPAGLSRRPLVRGLSTVMIAAAILRTVDGAMDFVIARKTAKPALELMRAQLAAQPPEGVNVEDATRVLNEFSAQLPNVAAAMTALLTLLVAGAFLAIGQYLRSERVLSAFPPPPESAH